MKSAMSQRRFLHKKKTGRERWPYFAFINSRQACFLTAMMYLAETLRRVIYGDRNGPLCDDSSNDSKNSPSCAVQRYFSTVSNCWRLRENRLRYIYIYIYVSLTRFEWINPFRIGLRRRLTARSGFDSFVNCNIRLVLSFFRDVWNIYESLL